MGYELDKLMKRFGVSTATVPQYSGVKAPSETVIPDTKTKSDALLTSLPGTDTKTTNKYYTAPVAPTAPVMPTAPSAFAGVTPVEPVKLGKGATADQLAAYNINNAKYLGDLNTFNANKTAATQAGKDYTAALTAYPNLVKTYDTNLSKYNTDKTTWDELQRKYDLDQKSYNNYVDEYKNRVASTPQYDPLPQGLGQTRPSTSMGQTTIPVTTPPVTPAINNTDISQWASKNPYATMQDAQKYQATNNLTNRDVYNATGSFYGNQLNPPSYGSLSNNFNNLTPQQQADQYAQQRNIGYTDADIKSKLTKQIGSPTDANWTAMQNLAFPTSLPVSKDVFNINNTLPEIDYTYAPNSQQQLENQAINAGYQGDYTDTAAMQEYLNSQYARGGSVRDLYRKYAHGGRVAHYADAGEVDIADSAMPRPEQGVPQPAPQMRAQPAPQQDDRMAQLQSMMEKYATPQNDYAQELEEARRRSNAETEAFTDMIKNARKSPERDNMSQAERYFRLAAAFGQPTKTGSLGETLGNVGQAMAENSKAEQQSQDQDLELQMKAQQLKAAGAKEDLSTLRSLSSEDKKMQREMVSNMIKAEIESGKPQSELAKIAKDRYGYGTPDYYSFLEKNVPAWVESKMAQMQMGPINAQNQLALAQGNYALNQERTNIAQKEFVQKTEDREQKKNEMSQPELKMKTDLQNEITALENAASKIQRAYKLNANSFGNTPMEQVKRKELELTVGDKDPKVKNTRELETFLGSTVLELAQDLKGSVSDSDTKMLNKMTGAQALGTDERADVLYENWSTLQKTLAVKKKQLNDITSKRAKAYDEDLSGE